MASGATPDERGHAKVRFPADLLDRFDMLMYAVRSKIMHAALDRARDRKRGAHARRVTEEDILLTTCEVFQETASKLDQELSKHGTRPVRVRTAS